MQQLCGFHLPLSRFQSVSIQIVQFSGCWPPFLRRVEIVHLPNRNLALRSERVTSFFSALFLLREKSKWSAEKTLGLYYVAGEKNPGLSLP